MRIILNGQSIEATSGATLSTLLTEREIICRNPIIELNGEILPAADDLLETILADGDSVNLFSLVPGG